MIGDGGYWCACVRCDGAFWGGKYSVMCPECKTECKALAAAARQGGDVKQAPGEAPQSGGRKPVTPEPYEPWDHPSSPSHIPLMNKDER